MLCPFLTSPGEGRPQHYITVGCVTFACCPYLPACTGPGGVYLWLGGICLSSKGVSASGPVGVSASGPGGCLPLVLGGVCLCSKGCVCIPACSGADTTPCGQKSSHTLLKILPCPNFIAVGNKAISLLLYIYVSQLLLVELSTQAR